MLNTRFHGKDFRTLSVLMKLTEYEIEELELNDNPTEVLLQKWELRKESTVNKLNQLLQKMGRLDVIQKISKKT